MSESRKEVEYREDRTFTKCVEYFIDAGDCDLRDFGNLVYFLLITVIRISPDFFGTHTKGLDQGEVERWMRPAAMYESRIASTCFERTGLSR